MISSEAGRNAPTADVQQPLLSSFSFIGQAVPMEDARRYLGALVMSARKRAGYRTLKEWSNAISLNPRTLSKVEAGKYVSREVLIEIENHLGWPTGQAQRVLDGEDITPAPEPRIEPTRSAAEVAATTDRDQLRELVKRALELVPHVRRTRGDDVANAWIDQLLAIAQETNADLRDEIRHRQ